MKLHLLTLQAFGPFAGQEQLRFDDLGEHPLFLIDGPTGAGKSSILHAICYALYGETTDADRKDLGLRSDHAAKDDLTFVCLEFSVRGQRFRIERLPTQWRPQKKGEGETEQKASAQLQRQLDNGDYQTLVAKKKTEADRQIVDILGLTASQFRQVMVLPQGRFRELLLAKSDERQQILSTLFQTQIYKEIELQLKQQYSQYEQQHKEYEKRRLEWLQEAELTNEAELNEQLKQLAGQHQQAHEARTQLEQQWRQYQQQWSQAQALAQRFEERTRLRQQQAELRKQEPEQQALATAITRAQAAQTLKPQWQAWQQAEQGLKARQQRHSQSQQSLNHAQQEQIQKAQQWQKAEQAQSHPEQGEQALRRQLDRLVGLQEQFDALAQAQAQWQQGQQAEQKANQHWQTLDQQHQKQQLQRQALREQVLQLQATMPSEAEIKEQGMLASQRVPKAEALAHCQAQHQQGQAQLTEQNAMLQRLQAQLAEQERSLAMLELAWHQGQAAWLASKLQPDQPCPVCGSAEHPQPAVAAHALVDKAQVDAARQAFQQAQAQQQSLASDYQRQQQTLEHWRQQISEHQQQLGEWAAKTLSDLQAEHERWRQAWQQCQAHKQALAAAVEQQNALERDIQSLEPRLEQARLAHQELAHELTRLHTLHTQRAAQLPSEYPTPQTLRQAQQQANGQLAALLASSQSAQQAWRQAEHNLAIKQAEAESALHEQAQAQEQERHQLKHWQQALEASLFAEQAEALEAMQTLAELPSWQQQQQEWQQQSVRVQSQLSLLDQQLADQPPPELAPLQAQQEQCKQQLDQQQQHLEQLGYRQQSLAALQQRLQRLHTEQQQLRDQVEVLGNLSRAASGQGRVRVSLERFVLGSLLDQVLDLASQRLRRMSRGQYSLLRQDEGQQKRNTSSGLDLAIDDAHSGKVRPVATLSGGESFMASLALALALSDVVQQRSGGIQLDTLFIDEGFGSLDSEALQLAINTLIELQAHGRTIGVISHVAELKEQMAQRIELLPSRQGSRIRVRG